MFLFAKPVPAFAGHALLLAALLLGGNNEARSANPPNVTDDIAPTRVIFLTRPRRTTQRRKIQSSSDTTMEITRQVTMGKLK